MSAVRIDRSVAIVLLLAIMMVATRMEHFGTAVSLPDASLAVFFFAGMALAQRRWFLLLLGVAAATDYYAITQAGVSGACFTAAYPFLAPAYACLWVAGQRARSLPASALARPLTMAVAAAAGSYLISSLGFYAFSGNFAAMPVIEYVARTAQYAPSYVGYAALYVGLGLAARALLRRREAAITPQPRSV